MGDVTGITVPCVRRWFTECVRQTPSVQSCIPPSITLRLYCRIRSQVRFSIRVLLGACWR